MNIKRHSRTSASPSQIKVAAVQMLVEDDPNVNLKNILSFMERAAAKKSDIVCFPETCLVPDERNTMPIKKHLQAIQSKCKALSIWCILGSYLRDRGMIRNLAFLFDRKGQLIYRYGKVHLWKSEIENGVVPGKFSRAIKTELGTFGIIICFDFAFPEFVKKLSMQGAEIIFCPSFMLDYEGWEQMLRMMPVIRAFEKTSYFVHCDAVTPDSRTAAMSYIAEPKKILAALEKKEGLIFATLDLKKIRRSKDEFSILR